MEINQIDESYLSDYKSENILLRARRNKIACLIAFVFMPIGAAFDYLSSPEQFWNLLGIRITVSGLVIVLYLSQISQTFKKHPVLISMVLSLLLNTSFCFMMYFTEGIASRYYAILSLLILGGGLLMAWTLKETILISLYTLIIYLLSAYFHSLYIDPLERWSLLLNNLYFIFLSGVLGGASSHFYTNARINDFHLRRQLDIRNRELEELDRLKSRFFANISHELRTPLTLILAPLQDLVQNSSAFDEKINYLVKTAHSNALRLLRLVNDLLDVIKLEEGKMQYQGEPIEIGKFLAAMVDSMRHLAGSHRIQIIKRLDHSGNIIIADSYLLERIFINLIGNAIKFTRPDGAITVIEEFDNGNVIIKITDTGIGISKEDLPYIFDRFHQAGNSSTHKTQGTGLGLALVKELTEQMQGHISVSSELGVGTTMQVLFPVSERLDQPASAVERNNNNAHVKIVPQSITEKITPKIIKSSQTITDPVVPAGDNPLVLIVDDEPDMRNYLKSSLENKYRIIAAQDGEQALDFAKKLNPDLILLDLMLPKIDGMEVCKQLKDSDETRHIKIMLLTARIDEGAKINALKNGADDFLTKPYSKVEVQTRLRNLLQTADLENRLRIHNKELENALFTLKQTQSQLIHSEKINALGRLTAGLLHEINNPLNYSLTALQFIQNEPALKSDEILQETFRDIDEGMHRIKSIISELQIYAHPSETSKQETFRFREALGSAVRFTAKEIETIRVIENIQEDDEISGSRGSIVQVLINLLTNAGKAINAIREPGTGEITVTTKSQNGRFNVYMRDNGVGINKDIIQNIFDPFYTSRDVGEGMGLGLSICDTIIKNHGGTLTVTSEPEKWTEFRFDLPAAYQSISDNEQIELQIVK